MLSVTLANAKAGTGAYRVVNLLLFVFFFTWAIVLWSRHDARRVQLE
jgi:hypothetical protein